MTLSKHLGGGSLA